MYKYIGEHLKYPEEARKGDVQGVAVVRFVVGKRGDLKDMALIRDPGKGCGEASLAVLEQMKADGIKWIPGRQRGKAVDVQLTLPFTFKFE